MADPFAELADLEDRWQAVPEQKSTRAITLLEAASRQVRQKVPDVDARIASGDLDPLLVTDVVCDMVRRVLTTPANGADSSTSQVGGTSVSATYGPGVGGLRLTRNELQLLEGTKGRGKASSVDALPAIAARASGTEIEYADYYGARALSDPYWGDPYYYGPY